MRRIRVTRACNNSGAHLSSTGRGPGASQREQPRETLWIPLNPIALSRIQRYGERSMVNGGICSWLTNRA